MQICNLTCNFYLPKYSKRYISASAKRGDGKEKKELGLYLLPFKSCC